MAETKLYRHWGNDGELLYVGISLSAVYRLSQHMDASHWSNSIAKVTIESYPTRKEAMKAEESAIIKENPAHNIMHKKAAEHAKALAFRQEAEEARKNLLKRYVAFKPMYSEDELPNVLGFTSGTTAVRKIIDSGELGHIVVTTPRGKDKRYVTGWQLIDYIESLQPRGTK